MSESGLSAAEVGKEIAEHLERSRDHEVLGPHHRRLTIAEAILLAVVALLAAWSGYAAAQWSTESRLDLSKGSAARTEASEAELAAMEARNFDASTFNAWFTAYVGGDERAADLAARRFRPELKVAFDAWLATDPFNDPSAPPGPTYMPEYQQPDKALAEEKRAEADELAADGAESGTTADDYVRITVLLASVLFIVGISGQFRIIGARYGLVVVGTIVLVYSMVLLVQAPKP